MGRTFAIPPGALLELNVRKAVNRESLVRHMTPCLITLLAVVACDARKQTPLGAPEPLTVAETDSGATADPMVSAQTFVSQPDGGDIVVEREIHQDLGINQIRSHLLLIARSFARGDFAVPGFIHDKPIPGTPVMADRASKIDYSVEDTEHGGIIHIRTNDAEALQAIHSFIAFEQAERKPDQ